MEFKRIRKRFQCFYKVGEKRVGVWENKKCCENTTRKVKVSVDSFLEFSKTFIRASCVTRKPDRPKNCVPFHLENHYCE